MRIECDRLFSMEKLTRNEAKARGLSRFWGDPCPKKHPSPRYVSTGACMACQKLRNSEVLRKREQKTHQCTREEAVKNGYAFYNTGKPCRNDHIGPRALVSGQCVQCRDEAIARRSKTVKFKGTPAEIETITKIWGAILLGRNGGKGGKS